MLTGTRTKRTGTTAKNALAAGVLDAELRAILRKEVALEHVEIEFERVMKVVFAV